MFFLRADLIHFFASGAFFSLFSLTGFSTLYLASVSLSPGSKPILTAILRQEASPAESVPSGITIKVSTVETNTPNSSEIAIPWKIGSDKITLEPPTRAKAVIRIGRVREEQELMTASKNGVPLAYSCTVKSTSRIELRTIIPAKAIQPIIEVAVNSAPNIQ